MPFPSTQLTTLRPELGVSLQEFDFVLDRGGFIGLKIFPTKEVQTAADKFGVIPLEVILNEVNTERASNGTYNMDDIKFRDMNWSTQDRGLAMPVDHRNAKLFEDYFDAEQFTRDLVLDRVLRAMERRIAAKVFNSTTWNGASLTTAAANDKEWSEWSAALPIDDVENAREKVYDGTGMWPNALIINRKVFNNLRNCEQVLDRIASQGAGESIKASKVTVEQIANVFALDYVFVAGGSRNTAKEGQSAVVSQIWSSEYAMVACVATDDNVANPCLGRTFHWGEDGSTIGGTVESYEAPDRRGHVIRCRMETDELVIQKECAHLISNITK